MADNVRFNPNIAAAPFYQGGASTEDIRKQYDLEDIIKMASNENALGPSPKAVEAIAGVAADLGRYPPMGDEELRASLAAAIGQGTSAENFVTGNGGCDVLTMIAHGFLQPGDEVIICRPTFPVYEITSRRVGATPVYVDLDPERFTYDVDGILSAVTDKTRLIYTCSPNNPTGTTLSAGGLEKLVRNAPPEAIVITDECYHHFATADDFPDSLAYVKEGQNVIIVHSFSKAYGLAGLRLGYAIAPPALAEYLWRARDPFHLSKLTFAAAQAALADQDHIQRSVEMAVKGRAYLYEQLCALDLRAWPSQANFVLFEPGYPANEVYERLLQRGVIVRPMAQFYLPTHIRVTVGLPEEDRRFVAALKEVLAELAQEGVSAKGAEEEDSGKFKF